MDIDAEICREGGGGYRTPAKMPKESRLERILRHLEGTEIKDWGWEEQCYTYVRNGVKIHIPCLEDNRKVLSRYISIAETKEGGFSRSWDPRKLDTDTYDRVRDLYNRLGDGAGEYMADKFLELPKKEELIPYPYPNSKSFQGETDGSL